MDNAIPMSHSNSFGEQQNTVNVSQKNALEIATMVFMYYANPQYNKSGFGMQKNPWPPLFHKSQHD